MGKLYDFLMEGEAAAQETAEVHISGTYRLISQKSA